RCLQNVGGEYRQFVQILAGLEDEHTAVPEIVARCHKLLGDLNGRLFDELPHRVSGTRSLAAANVAVARFRRMSHDAEGHQPTVFREAGGDTGGLLKYTHIADH